MRISRVRESGLHRHGGFTMVELLVALTIIAILLAITIPAIQSARESARRQECVNQQRQIGIALLNFESQHGHFPAKDHGKGLLGSWIVAILPHLEQQPLYDEFVAACGGSIKVREEFEFRFAWEKARWMTPAGFHCPSDPAPARWQNSYPSNSGTWAAARHDDGMFRFAEWSYVGYPLGPVRLGDVTDGLGNTMSVCEWLHDWKDDQWHQTIDTPRRMIWKLPKLFGSGADIESLAEVCRQVPPVNPERYGWKSNGGLSIEWFTGGITVSSYVHVMPPNTASCEAITLGMESRLATVGSYHRNGVNGLFADGHVQFISDSIDLNVWRALGTRNGSDDVTF